VHVFRALVSETRETRIERALSAGLNLRIATEYIDGMEKVGPWVEEAEGMRRLKDAPASDAVSEFGDTVGPGEIQVDQ
jgi:hypothetical protein